MNTGTPHYANLSDRDLLGKLIGARESRRIYQGSLQPFFSSSPEEGAPHAKCAIARELVSRWLNEIHFAGREYESFVILYLDARHRLIEAEELFRGTLTGTSVHPREVVKGVLRKNAGAVIISHNHPSGVPDPSQADIRLTETLKQALALVDVRVLDHFIIAGANTMSFAERGLL